MEVPVLSCDSLKINLQLAGINGFSGSATRFGAFQAAVDNTQDRTIENLDPRQCTNKATVVQAPLIGNGYRTKYGVHIQWEQPDCNDYDTDCENFVCTDGELSTPTTNTTEFVINECMYMNINIPYKSWKNTCCGVEEYYTQILNARKKGATATQLQGMINSAGERNRDRSYESMLVAEKIGGTLRTKFAALNTYVLDKFSDNAGYNFVTDAYTGAVVGTATWEVPVLELAIDGYQSQFTGSIDPNAFRKELSRFIVQHPNCTKGITIIGGRAIEEMIESMGVRCCDSTGINQAQAIQKVLGYLTNFYVDDTIDALYPAGTFFIIENGSVALFWLAMLQDPARRQEKIEGISGIYREFGTLSIPVADCRNNGMLMTFDSLVTAKVATCLDDVNYNLQLRAEYELFTMPAQGCINPRTGIYKALLVDKLKPVVAPVAPV